MNWLIRGLLMPTQNRHYMGKRLHVLRFMFGFVPITLVCLVAFVASSNVLWLLGLLALLVYGLIIYHTYDKATDTIMWNKFYKRHFAAPKPPPGYEEMKAYESNPSSVNKNKLEKVLKEK